MTHTIGMISLGYAKNQVNAEHMLWLLRQAGSMLGIDLIFGAAKRDHADRGGQGL